MSDKIIAQTKINYASQDADTGTISIKVLLCQTPHNHYYACYGHGENLWVMKNGCRMDYTHAAGFFAGINEFEKYWIN